MSANPISAFNAAAELQEMIVNVINGSSQISSLGISAIRENALDVDYQIKNSLQKQGLSIVVMTPKITLQGSDGTTNTYAVDELQVLVTEYVPINRASTKQNASTALDVGMFLSEYLAGRQSPLGYGSIQFTSAEQGEDSGLLVVKTNFKTYVQGQWNGGFDPWGDYYTKAEIDARILRIGLEISQISGQVLEISSQISGFATEQWVIDQGYATSAEISSKASIAYVDEQISATVSQIPSLEGYATEQWVQQQDYATESEVQTMLQSKASLSGSASQYFTASSLYATSIDGSVVQANWIGLKDTDEHTDSVQFSSPYPGVVKFIDVSEIPSPGYVRMKVSVQNGWAGVISGQPQAGRLLQTTQNGILVDAGTNAATVSQMASSFPSAASQSNQLADKAFVNSSINAVAAYYITKDISGNPFSTYAELSSATQFWSGGESRTPTKNDYAIVLADETHPSSIGNPTSRYSFQGSSYPQGQWEYQYSLNNTPFTQAQINAINSGITSNWMTQTVDQISSLVDEVSLKQDRLSETQIDSIDAVPTKAAISSVYLKSELSTITLSGEYDDEQGGTFSFNLLVRI